MKYNKTKANRLASPEVPLQSQKRPNKKNGASGNRKSVRLIPETASKFKKVCIFCNDDNSKLHQVSTFEVDYRIRKIASKISDTHLLSKLSEGDLIACRVWYHKSCLATYYNFVKFSS